eukprot:TRINITY_DN4285_c0_g1_i1.p1 TRINITY_DN4285_c0_g1~~TRINITY_DN4285_c0_g1_i1.p1  ORF type:complete len:122 (+),score=18.87 TRINITY_DN4285_c0_g1_i1:25-390(+)
MSELVPVKTEHKPASQKKASQKKEKKETEIEDSLDDVKARPAIPTASLRRLSRRYAPYRAGPEVHDEVRRRARHWLIDAVASAIVHTTHDNRAIVSLADIVKGMEHAENPTDPWSISKRAS